MSRGTELMIEFYIAQLIKFGCDIPQPVNSKEKYKKILKERYQQELKILSRSLGV